MNIVKSVEVRTAHPVYIKPNKGRCVAGVVGSETVICLGVKVHRLSKGGYSVRFLGTGQPVSYVSHTALLTVAQTNGDSLCRYVGNLFD